MFARGLLPVLRGAPGVGPLTPAAVGRCFATKVTFVKKIYADGSTCQKCDFVWKQIEKDGLTGKIDRTVYADERDMSSEGIVLAKKHKVTRAPFFVVEDDAKPEEGEKIFDVYFKLKKDVFAQETGEAEKNEEIIRGMMKQVF
uniref:Thioredoxin domain-containing protein n=1 Tax=Alexandrium monilatum TaxID=311494 RepID=A0A7S4Q6J4_9DINO|mmetsp:Transcript_727/g.2462  ORF Transcript_727/g.2462 Transcript_727/m.2462 type:complete len:143 (+) Transcript_727:65-493(+)|eukprot:CAMPEP_0175406408 /NCGR_PEP_ID=MMETSP0095-20121207/39550_1 /TAXON_ID=311494 /ORGANISM="Alexandrium monilatum, Strain CCMP3105" /LENGTH=142 /DNA_ID=CAMNT_0016705271 /DNA_START=59 /DNA_END=487 /DNA_ORIENTATION=+